MPSMQAAISNMTAKFREPEFLEEEEEHHHQQQQDESIQPRICGGNNLGTKSKSTQEGKAVEAAVARGLKGGDLLHY